MNRSLIMRSARKRGYRFHHNAPIGILCDFAADHLGWSCKTMFEGAEVGSLVMVETLSFPYVGRVIECTEARVVLEDAVKVLWDGRHGQYAGGEVPASAEIEKTFSPLRINADAVIAWGDWPGKDIPKAQ